MTAKLRCIFFFSFFFDSGFSDVTGNLQTVEVGQCVSLPTAGRDRRKTELVLSTWGVNITETEVYLDSLLCPYQR